MQIHWHEGLFLLPHHLQRQQREVIERFTAERQLLIAYPYGVIEARLVREELENMRVRFDRLRAVMPSGLEVNFPQDAELPALDIKSALESLGSFTIYLAIPLWFPARANCVAPGESVDPRAKILYRVFETEYTDENTGANPKPMLERRVNARLLIDKEDRSDLETIPLLRVTRSVGEDAGLPKEDPEFSGPAFILNGSSNLRDLLRGFNSQLQAIRQELMLQINRGGFNPYTLRADQFEQLLRLQTLNRSGGRLESLLLAPSVPPFEFYLELRTLLGDLCALHPERDLYASLPYNHDEPYPCFLEMVQKIRLFLRGNVLPNFVKIDFEPRGGVLCAGLTEEHFTQPNDYFLGIRTKEEPTALARLVENDDRFKLMPISMANRAVRGVLLKEERFPPMELPAVQGLYYFRLLRSESTDVWQRIREEKSAIVRWSGNDSADYQVSLYMTMPTPV